MARFYLTTAIDYVNSRPHLGTAYEKIAADVIARYKRLCGIDTHFVMGNDEHSQNVFRKARELGEDPLAYCDRMAQEFLDVWKRLDISFDDFIRTTEPRHKAGGPGTRPPDDRRRRHLRGALRGLVLRVVRGLQAGEGSRRRHCPIHRTKPDWIREKNYFFRLSKYTDRLRQHFEWHPEFLVPDVRRNEILRLIEGGPRGHLGQPRRAVVGHSDARRSVERDLRLGRRADQLPRARSGTAPTRQMVAKWWPADLHVIGKDITRFHAVIWPAMLMSAGRAGAAADLRARLGQLPRREDEQVARHRRRSRSTRRRDSAPIRCGCIW